MLPPGEGSLQHPWAGTNTAVGPSTSVALAEQSLRPRRGCCPSHLHGERGSSGRDHVSWAQGFGLKGQCFLSCTGQVDPAAVKKQRCAIKTRQAESL